MDHAKPQPIETETAELRTLEEASEPAVAKNKSPREDAGAPGGTAGTGGTGGTGHEQDG